MTEKLEFYKCKICGNLVQVILDGVGALVCCNEPMQKLDTNKQESGTSEYHIPVYKKEVNGVTYIQVGKEPHPMTEEHHIEFIEQISNDKSRITLQYLHIGESPRMEVHSENKNEYAQEYCNIHGLWKGENNVEF